MIDKGKCDKGLLRNPSNYEFEFDKSCDFGQYLDYENRKCRKKIADKLVEECSENIDGNEINHDVTLDDYVKVCNFCTMYTVLLVIPFLIIIGISSAYFYFYWNLKNNSYVNTNTITNAKTEALFY